MLYKDVLFPRFSESELFSLSWIIILSAIKYYRVITDTVSWDWLLLFVIPIILYFTIRLFVNIFTHTMMPKREKAFFSTIFYSVLSAVTITANVEFMTRRSFTFFDYVEIALLAYTALKALLTLCSVLLLDKFNQHDVYASQMESQQMEASEIGFILISSSVIFLLVADRHVWAISISLTHVYVSMVKTLIFSRGHQNIFGRISELFRRRGR